jgi:hypothetical protein
MYQPLNTVGPPISYISKHDWMAAIDRIDVADAISWVRCMTRMTV